MEKRPMGDEEIIEEISEDTESVVGEEEEEEEVDNWDDWDAEDEDSETDLLCLFCNSRFSSSEALFSHCSSEHSFDFRSVKEKLGLDFYACFKLINYIRAQVSENKCWSCGMAFQCQKDLLDHQHAGLNFEKNGKLMWEDDSYLKPFMPDDALLHSFIGDGDDEDEECVETVDKEELMRELGNDNGFTGCIENGYALDFTSPEHCLLNEGGMKAFESNKVSKDTNCFGKNKTNGGTTDKDLQVTQRKVKDKHLKVSFAIVAARELKNVNDNYFGAYGSFGIHREMISDKVRMDAYRGALLNNPSLMNQATVMDVGCGTGILSLFAAQAGASRVIAVEASEKMAGIAKQIIKNNGLLSEGNEDKDIKRTGVIKVVQGMVEELDKRIQIPHHSIDVLVSEWMGYCLLFESMLSSVIYARDHWLKPGGAILPDTATIFAAGFGRGGTSIPFWENVHGFDMSCIGKEVSEDAAQVPIVDVLDNKEIVTDSVILHSFDLATMKPDEVDFTATVELELKSNLPGDSMSKRDDINWCYGIVLWFETGFTSRFCKEKAAVLSTSPYSQKTHWSQTIFTFREPIAMISSKCASYESATVGTEECPASRIEARISIVKAAVHRSIDISLEVAGISMDGRKHCFPVQIFNL